MKTTLRCLLSSNVSLSGRNQVALLSSVASKNPFNTSHFLWVDMGMWRVPHDFRRWPYAARLEAWPADRVLGLQVRVVADTAAVGCRCMNENFGVDVPAAGGCSACSSLVTAM